MAAFNEEDVIDDKMKNLLELNFETSSIRFWIGSDGSSDRTVEIVKSYAQSYFRIHFFDFQERRGKSSVINELIEKSSRENAADILLMTDASVMSSPDVLQQAVAQMSHYELAYVDIPIVPRANKEDGITLGEQNYLSFETRLKTMESLIWQQPMGVYGGFYLLKRKYFEPVPAEFAVDDFFLILSTLEKGGKGDIMTHLPCWEPHSGSLLDEYKRKRRISGGNMQNLWRFRKMLVSTPLQQAYSFLSHKVLRWFGPFWIALMLLSSGILALIGNNIFTCVFLLLVIGIVIIPVIDYLLTRTMGLKLWTRNIRYFVWMNLALLAGIKRQLNGIKGNVWDPPKRS